MPTRWLVSVVIAIEYTSVNFMTRINSWMYINATESIFYEVSCRYRRRALLEITYKIRRIMLCWLKWHTLAMTRGMVVITISSSIFNYWLVEIYHWIEQWNTLMNSIQHSTCIYHLYNILFTYINNAEVTILNLHL